MHNVDPALLKEEPPLAELTESIRKGRSISWYRCPLTSAQVKALHRKSDFQGAVQTLGHLGIAACTAAAALFSAAVWPWWTTALLVLLHGTVISFHPNAVHELGHATVFRTRRLNVFFCHLYGFLGWNNHETFQSSHTRHHRYTLHPPDDLEVVLPIRLVLWHFLRDGIVNVPGLIGAVRTNVRIARGRFQGEWELTLYPETARENRRAARAVSRRILAGHGLILLVSALTGYWMLVVVFSLAPFCGNLLFFLCNSTQHVGLQDNVDDFRLCCRTFTLNPVVRFLYWQMNYHIEHHMFAAVPCYHLGELHAAIRPDLPPIPRGLLGVWREIFGILKRQETEPGYQHVVTLPPPTERGEASAVS